MSGTGKTTTIQTIASYLGKDIYYVNLKEFETNSDIQMIYDYISKNTGNGIIVYEDIDCMSDVVLKRTSDIKEISINDICDIENDKLSLSYFLNLLQGCLTPDDSINILTTNFKDKLDSAIFRSGRMDLTLELKPCSHFQIRNIFRKLMKREINEDVLKKIPEYKHTPATIIYHLKNYRKCTTMSDMDIFQNNFSE
jgi:chaperone BCS1